MGRRNKNNPYHGRYITIKRSVPADLQTPEERHLQERTQQIFDQVKEAVRRLNQEYTTSGTGLVETVSSMVDAMNLHVTTATRQHVTRVLKEVGRGNSPRKHIVLPTTFTQVNSNVPAIR